MMYRYLACVWDSADHRASDFAALLTNRMERDLEWLTALQAPGAHVWHTPTDASRACALSENKGVVLGTLFRGFDACGRRAADHFTEPESERIVASGGSELIDKYWGRYVAFLRNAGKVWILRDPTGGLPCYRLVERGVSVFFNDLDDVLRVKLRRNSPNWEFLHRVVCVTGGIQDRATGLEGVTQILGGEAFVHLPQGSTQVDCVWNPYRIAQDIIEDSQQAEVELRQAVHGVVDAWASCYPRMLLSLSGGLDSSIVAECLARASTKPDVSAFNYYDPAGADSDERRYASLVAGHVGIALREVERRPTWQVGPLLASARPAPSPGNHMSFIEPASVENALANDHGARVVITGFGGDQLFVQETPLATIDYARRAGWGPALWRAAMDEARMERASVWEVLKNAFRGRPSDAKVLSRVGANRSLMNLEFLEGVQRAETTLHEPRWPSASDVGARAARRTAVGPGKAFQIQQLSYPAPLHNPLSPLSAPEYVSPLMSQPLMETCLRIPTYIHTRGGERRSLARQAFRSALPPEIINRWTKGGYEEQIAELLQHNARFVKETLLDGELMRRRILDRTRVEEWLSGRPTRLATANSEVWDYIFFEAWHAGLGHCKVPESTDLALAI